MTGGDVGLIILAASQFITQQMDNTFGCENLLPCAQGSGNGEAGGHLSPSTVKTEDREDNENSIPGYEDVDGQESVCEQQLDLWAVYQRAAAEQFSVLAGLYDQLEAVAAPPLATPGSGQDSPRTPGGRARLAVCYTTCKQLHSSSQQQSTALAAQVRDQLRQLTGQLQRNRATFAKLARLVQRDSSERVAVSPDAVVPAVRGVLLTLTEHADGLAAELSEVSGRLERCQQKLRSPLDPDPAELRLQVQLEDRDRQIELLQTRAGNARAQAEELQKQLTELRELSASALEKSVSRLEGLEAELLKSHTKYRDSQRELYQTRSQLSREVASLSSERDTLAVRVDRYRRLQEAGTDHATLEKEAAVKALQVLTADRRRLLTRLSDCEAERSRDLTRFEEAKHNWRLDLQRVDRSDLVNDLRLRLEGAELQLTEMETEHRDTSAALREELALRSSQVADLTSQLLQAKRTIVQQEIQNDYLQQRLESLGDAPPPSDASQLTTARLSEGSVSDSRLARPDGGRGQGTESGDEERQQLRRQAAAAQEQASRLTAQREEAVRTTDMLRTELRVALEALQNQRREADLRLLSSSDTRLHELGQMEQQTRELRALSTRWQVRAEASERGCREVSEALEEERARRLEMEASLVEASAKMREIQQQLERQDQYSTWAKLNQSLQLKQVESVMLSLLKVAPGSVGGGADSPRSGGGGGEVTPPADGGPLQPPGILKRRQWSPPPPPGEAGYSAGSLTSTDAELEVATDASLATTEPERFVSLAGQLCDSSGEAGDPLSEL